ncbi:multicopper oxidase family protein [Capillimicrobium parvum]|uniref:Spore coat protein A n=1 Tax=Capillimicrobium parvum TaxID=2884022 RepID=A0A9E7C2E5_9ACTN|nr:multicopper oxidase [Capillimicrobium parvum]UGS37664.1 Spore coat protein A [Capillimicrobium parvum]
MVETSLRFSRRTFVAWVGGASAGYYLFGRLPGRRASEALALVAGGTLDPTTIAKFQTPMLIPPVMPRAATIRQRGDKPVDYYEISMRQFEQQILPAGLPATTVWGYGAKAARSNRGLLVHHAPSLTIEARQSRPVRVRWINELVSADGSYLPHLFAVDQTLHWANPPGGTGGRDSRPRFTETPGRYTGPVPMVTHVHGAVGVNDDSDGYAEAWYLPAATDIPAGYATEGTWYEFFAGQAARAYGVEWGPGFATFQYPNDNRAATIWYHDHALGMTRLNVYAGPAGFYLIRGGPDDVVLDSRTGLAASLPGPAPRENDRFPSNKRYREIAIAIQDRSFNTDGSLFYPDSRAFFDGIVHDYIPDGEFSPIWNPEFFGNTIMVNGNTWPFQTVEQRRYRLRFLNGCQSRFLMLDFNRIPDVEVWQIGNEGGFLAAPVNLTANHENRLLMGPAERADVIADFTNVPLGNHILANIGPDEPFGGGEPDEDFDHADADTTGQIMQFRVVPAVEIDDSTPPRFLQLPAITPLPAQTHTRQVALIEKADEGLDEQGEAIEGPVEALLGTVTDGVWTEREWTDPVTENPGVGDTEVWEIYNTTADAHPMHIHEITFEVVNRQRLLLDESQEQVVQPIQLDGDPLLPEPGETGFKDTVIAYPGQVTRVRAQFDTAGQFVWHCHIVEHEDNEMMRPYRIGPRQPGQPD